MKLVFVMAGNYFNFYDLSKINIENVKFIALINKNNEGTVSEFTKASFDEYIVIPDDDKRGYLYGMCIESSISFIESCMEKYNSKKIYISCSSEGNLITASKLREYFDVDGFKPSEVERFRDKTLMKDILRNEGILVPKNEYLNVTKICIKSYYDYLEEKFGKDFIIKPVSSGGGYGVYKIGSFLDLKTLSSDIIQENLNYQVEELLTGDLYHCDISYYNNEVIFQECALYNFNNHTSNNKNNIIGSMVLRDESKIKKQILEFCINCIKKMGGYDSFYHCEVFLNDGELTFLEVGARVPGATITQMYEKMYGVNLLNIDMLLQADEINHLILKRKCYGFWACLFIFEDAMINSLNYFWPNNSSINWYISEKTIVQVGADGYKHIADILLLDEDYRIIKKFFDELKKFKLIDFGSFHFPVL